ncbi:MAG: hypothetical protein H6587_05850 [Flavobacteriales bacterium]|nr:hypothetical protein [Flavobacteriales bacterium]MCB9364074.1 hypothetical protein [Flavobacteriales bacterium]
MKNSFRIFSICILLAIYCFAISIANNLPYNAFIENQTNKQTHYFSSQSSNLFYHTEQQLEPSLNDYEGLYFPDFENANTRCLIINASVQLFKTELLQYYNFSKLFLIKYRKTDIIFPFQYFW